MTQAFRAHDVAPKDPQAEHRIFMEPTPKEIRVVFGGETIVRSRGVLIQHETRHVPVYYFPLSDVRMEFLEPIERRTH